MHFKKENKLFVFLFTKSDTTSFPGFLGQQFNNLQRAALLPCYQPLQSIKNFRSRAIALNPLRDRIFPG